MAKSIFTEKQISNIKKVIADKKNNPNAKVWDNATLKDVRAHLKFHIRSIRHDGNKCAYCLKDFRNEHNMSIDVEHILPKSAFPEYTFSLKNLTIACKRCNLQIKNNDVSFLSNDFDRKKPFKSKYYSITHPVIDKNKLDLLVVHFKEVHIIKYTYSNDKSKNTYKYFKLREVEIDTLNSAQGINPVIDFFKGYA